MILSLIAKDTNIFAGTSGNGVFLSSNNGSSWTAVNNGLTSSLVSSFALSGNNLFAGTGEGLFRSPNNGESWTATGLMVNSVWSLAVSGTNIFAGVYAWDGGVFLTTNNGTSWSAASTGLKNTIVWSFAVSDTYLFAGTEGGGVWRRPLSEMITSVDGPSSMIPDHFSLGQNYPNPFNPKTVISYRLSVNSKVGLSVYDILGRVVATLVDEEKPAGAYTVTFDASKLSSGIYFYRLQARPTSGKQAGSFIETKKLVLIK